MDANLVYLLHVTGVLVLFTGIGILYTAARRGETSGANWKTGNIVTGVGLLVVLLFGFARMHTWGWPAWGFVKVAVWLVLAVLPVFLKRNPARATPLLLTALGLGALALYLVYYKPI